MPKLSQPEIAAHMNRIAGWMLDGDAIRKQFTFTDFP